jgi:hypothetical protein
MRRSRKQNRQTQLARATAILSRPPRYQTPRPGCIRLTPAQQQANRIQLNARKFAFSILTSGANFGKTSDVFLINGIRLPSRSRLYAVQHEFFEPIRQYCVEQCKYWEDQMDDETIVAFDGAWSHRRNAKECIVILIDCNHKRIIDFEIVTKSKCGNQGNWDGSSNGMELRGVELLIERWKTKGKIKGVVHDNDSKATLAIERSGWEVDQWYDPNHVVKQFETRWKSARTNFLRGIHAKLLLWFKYLIRSDFTNEEKKQYWMNSLEHFKGNHKGCPREHPGGDHFAAIKNPNAEAQLRAILADTKELLGRARTGFDTQLCESCNSLKTKFANKDTSWKCSWGPRVMCALMQVNSLDNWRITLARLCNLSLSADVIAELDQRWQEHLRWQAARGTEEARLKACRQRWERRHHDSLQKKGREDYGHPFARQHQPEEPEPEITDEPHDMVPYSEALARDPSIEVPKEAGDDEVRIVRNERRFTRGWPDCRPWDVAFLEVQPGRTSLSLDVFIDEVEDNLDDENNERDEESDDDDEHVTVLQGLPPGLPISEETFQAEGREGNTLVMRCRNPQPIQPQAQQDAALAEAEEIISVAVNRSPEERRQDEVERRQAEFQRRPLFRTGTHLVERYSGLVWDFITTDGDGTLVVINPEGTVIAYFRPGELEMQHE